MQEARECNYVAEHYNWIVQMQVTGSDLRRLKRINQDFQKHWTLFDRSLDTVLGCMQGGSQGELLRDYYAKRIDCKPNEVYGVAKRALSIMKERKIFMQKAPCKIDMVKEIVSMFPHKNIITFGEYIDFADELTAAIGPAARSFHSKLASADVTVTKSKSWKTEAPRERFLYNNRDTHSNMRNTHSKPNQYTIEWDVQKRVGPATIKKMNVADFIRADSEVHVLNTAKSLDEAADIEKVDVAIIVSFTSTARQLLQRIGRAIRFKKGKVAHIFILCLTQPEGRTQEERWLKDALAELDEYIKIHFIDIKNQDYA